MKTKLSIVTVLAAALVLTSVATAHAKWGEGRGGEEKRKKADEKQMRERVELMKMWKLIEVLELDQETAAKLFPLMNEFDAKQQDLQKTRRETIKQMREELEKDASKPDALRSLIDRFKQNERDMVEMRIRRLDSLTKILSDDQIAKMIMFVPKFERGVREMLGEARARQKDRRDQRRERIHTPPEFGGGPMFE